LTNADKNVKKQVIRLVQMHHASSAFTRCPFNWSDRHYLVTG